MDVLVHFGKHWRKQWGEDIWKARPRTALIHGEEPVTLVTALLISDTTSKEVFYRLWRTYQCQNIQSQFNLRSRLYGIQLSDNDHIQSHLTPLEGIIVWLPTNSNVFNKSEEPGIFSALHFSRFRLLLSLCRPVTWILLTFLVNKNPNTNAGRQENGHSLHLLNHTLLPVFSMPWTTSARTLDQKSLLFGIAQGRVPFKVNLGFA